MPKELRLNRPLTYETFPHRCELNELSFEIADFALDDDEPIEPDDGRVLDLDDYEGWEEAKLTLEVEVSERVLREVFPEAGDSDSGGIDDCPGSVVVAGHCVPTYTRGGTVLNPNDGSGANTIGPGTVSDTFTIRADQVAGQINLHPYLLRSSPLSASSREELGLDSDHDYATEPGMILSDGPTWSVQIEEEESGSDDVLLVERTSFEEENEAEDSPFPPADRLYYLDLKRDPENPVLYFNEDYTRIVDVVWNGDGRYDELTSELVWDHVMSSVWARLVQVAAAEYDPETETWTPEWQPAVFEEVHGHLYPDDDTSPEKAAEWLQSDFDEDPLSATEKIERAVQGVLNPANQFDDHINRLRDS